MPQSRAALDLPWKAFMGDNATPVAAFERMRRRSSLAAGWLSACTQAKSISTRH